MSREVPLSRGMVALVDDEDYDRVVAVGNWNASECSGQFYARHWYKDQFGIAHTLGMHTFLTRWNLVDHVNGNGLDNRRQNLRPATSVQNLANTRRSCNNTTGYKGVSLYARTGRYRAYIGMGGAAKHLGYYDTPEEAARAYDAAAADSWGEYARLNFPQEETPA